MTQPSSPLTKKVFSPPEVRQNYWHEQSKRHLPASLLPVTGAMWETEHPNWKKIMHRVGFLLRKRRWGCSPAGRAASFPKMGKHRLRAGGFIPLVQQKKQSHSPRMLPRGPHRPPLAARGHLPVLQREDDVATGHLPQQL